MAYKIQSDKEVEMKKARKYVFEHKNTREIEGFNELKMAKSIVLSPSWIATSEASKALYKKEKAKLKAE
jgi:hypothetical protein